MLQLASTRATSTTDSIKQKAPSSNVIIIIIIIERKDLGGVMSKDCKDTLQKLKTVAKRECDEKWEQSICQMRS